MPAKLVPRFGYPTMHGILARPASQTLATLEDVQTVALLLGAGADPNALNRYGATALSLAARTGNAVVLDALFRAGASMKTAAMKSIVSEAATPEDLKKYGLDKPAATVDLKMGSAHATFLLGGKAETKADGKPDGKTDATNTVYARDASKPAFKAATRWLSRAGSRLVIVWWSKAESC